MRTILAALALLTVGGAASAETTRSLTGPNGRTADTTVQRSYDAATGTYSRDVTVETGSGRSAIRTNEVVCVDGTCVRQRAITGPRGNVATSTGTVAIDRGVGVDATVSRTGRRGGEATVTRSWRRIDN